jgi:uncharacterized protein (UPF0332 family)
MQQELDLSQEFLRDAESLFKQNGYRSSLSRCYYAVYHACIALFRAYGFRPSNFIGRDGRSANRWEHGIIRVNFFLEFVQKRHLLEWKAGGQIRRLYSDRINADYQPNAVLSQTYVECSLNIACEFVEKIKGLVKS